MDIKFQSAVIFVSDIHTSRRFYEQVLGQTVLMDHGPNVGFAGGFALWQADHAAQIIFGRPAEQAGPPGHDHVELYFETGMLDDACRRLEEAGATFIHPLRTQPWGQRVFRVYDPDRHIVELGEPMPVVVLRFLSQGLSLEETARQTSMPLEIVRQIAGAAPQS